jgi:hypothetical protein
VTVKLYLAMDRYIEHSTPVEFITLACILLTNFGQVCMSLAQRTMCEEVKLAEAVPQDGAQANW